MSTGRLECKMNDIKLKFEKARVGFDCQNAGKVELKDCL